MESASEIQEPDAPRRGKRKKGLSRAKRLSPPRLDSGTRNALRWLTRQLATATPERRRELVAGVRARSAPLALSAIIDAVLGALLRSQNSAARTGLADALVMLDPGVVSTLILALSKAKKDRQRESLVEILARVGPTLPRGERVALLFHLCSLTGPVGGPEPVAGVNRAVAALRLSLDQDPNP